VFKKKKRKNYRRKSGHRQELTVLPNRGISRGGIRRDKVQNRNGATVRGNTAGFKIYAGETVKAGIFSCANAALESIPGRKRRAG